MNKVKSETGMVTTVNRIRLGLMVAALSLGAHTAIQAAPINGTGLVTPDIIFGSGNANGSFTGQTLNNIEVGLRGKQRYPAANIFNYDGVNTYTFDSTVLTTNPANRSIFNFEWSINVDQDGSSGATLSDFGYLFSFDTDPTAGVAYTSFDPFNTPGFYDHALGLNTTPNGGGTVSASNADLLTNMTSFNVAQQSANLGFGYSADPDLPGVYDFKMDVLDLTTSQTLSSAEIRVLVTPVPVPEPATLALMLGGVGLIGFTARRRLSKKA
jgi:hypothetical protein